MDKYLDKVKQLLSKLKKDESKQLPREQNNHVGAFAKIAWAIKANQKRTIPIEILYEKGIDTERQVSTFVRIDVMINDLTSIQITSNNKMVFLGKTDFEQRLKLVDSK